MAAIGVIHDGSATVAAAGTANALSTTSVKCNWITFQPLIANTGAVYIGASTVTATRGLTMSVGDSAVTWDIMANACYDLSKIFIDGATNGNGVQFVYAAL